MTPESPSIRATRERKERARAGFDRWRDMLYLADWGLGVPAFRRVEQAQRDVREWRRAHNQQERPEEPITLAVRVAASVFASEIEAHAGPERDPVTISWVTAGLRCRSRPFCIGCNACQTVTAPDRVQIGDQP